MNKNLISACLGFVALSKSLSGGTEPFSEWAEQQVKAARSGTVSVISLEKGTYHVKAYECGARLLHLSNNDDGVKHILFDLSGLENVVVEGNGAELILHGRVIPFFIKGSENITIRNLTIDWANPFFGQGEVCGVGKGWFEVQFEDDYPVEVRGGVLYFLNPDLPDPITFCNINFFDRAREDLVFQSWDEYGVARSYKALDKGKNRVRIVSRKIRSPIKVGHVAVFQYAGRAAPALAVQRSKGIHLENLTQYHAAAIANLFEGSTDIYIDNLQVVRRPHSGRFYSTHHDATHFVDCRGDIFLRNSRIEFQGDDSCNIHGVFRTVYANPRPNVLRTKLNHFQQIGLDTLYPGDLVGFHDALTLEYLGEGRLSKVTRLNPQDFEMVFEKPLPDINWTRAVLALRPENVHVDISGNSFSRHRARGLLIKTLGKVRIHDNYFHVQGAAIKIRNEASSWYEAGPVDDVEIYNNVFDQCNTGGFSRATFEIDPTLEDTSSEAPVFRNIRIHNNRIIQIFKPLLIANNVEGLEFYDNEIVAGEDYELWYKRPGNPGDYLFGKGVTKGKFQLDDR